MVSACCNVMSVADGSVDSRIESYRPDQNSIEHTLEPLTPRRIGQSVVS